MTSNKFTHRRRFAGTPKICKSKPPPPPPPPPPPRPWASMTLEYFPLLDFIGADLYAESDTVPAGEPIEVHLQSQPELPANVVYQLPLNKQAHGGGFCSHPDVGIQYTITATFHFSDGQTLIIQQQFIRP